MIELNVKQLTNDQYDAARTQSIERVKQRIGVRPERKHFQRQLGSLWTPLDWLAMVVFVAALLVSSAHIIKHMGDLAANSYEANASGIVLDQNAYTILHQLGMIALAEASALLFMIMHGMSGRKFSVPLALAIIAAVFIFVANVQSGIGLLEAVMPPVFTLGIGLHLERLIVATIRRRADIDARYVTALELYEAATADPTAHPDFMKMFRQELWQKLVGLAANKEYKDAPPGIRHWAVQREMERDTWAAAEQLTVEAWQPERPTPARATTPRRSSNSGSSALTMEDDEDTTPMPTVNAPTADASEKVEE